MCMNAILYKKRRDFLEMAEIADYVVCERKITKEQYWYFGGTVWLLRGLNI